MQAITTKFYGPTNTRGSRVKASAQAGNLWHSWDYELGDEGNHDAAAKAFRRRNAVPCWYAPDEISVSEFRKAVASGQYSTDKGA